MKRYKLKQSVKNAVILLVFYLFIVGGTFMISVNNKRLNKIYEDQKKTELSRTQLSQK